MNDTYNDQSLINCIVKLCFKNNNNSKTIIKGLVLSLLFINNSNLL